MTVPTPPTRLQLSEEQYVADLASLFRRYRLDCGTPECLAQLGPQLQTNAALRGDLFNLCTAISHMGESDLSPEELLDLVARAAAGSRFADGDCKIPADTRNSFLGLYSQWSNRSFDSLDLSQDAPTNSPASLGDEVWGMPIGRFSAAAAIAAAQPQSQLPLAEAGPLRIRPAITPDTRLGELTISELKRYLDDVESRIGRLRPHLASVAGTGETFVGYDTAEDALAGDAVEPQEESPADRDPLPAGSVLLLDLDAADATATHPSSFPGIEVASELPTEAPAIQDGPEIASPEPVENDSTESEPVLVLPLPVEAAIPEGAMFRSVSEAPGKNSRLLPWLAAAVVLIGAGAGYGYRYLHRTPELTSPTMLPAPRSSGESAPSQEPPPTAVPESASPAPPAPETTPETPNQTSLRRRSRSIGSSPRLLPREVQMEAQAARAAAAQSEASGSGQVQPAPSTTQYPSAPIVRPAGPGQGLPASPGTAPSDPH